MIPTIHRRRVVRSTGLSLTVVLLVAACSTAGGSSPEPTAGGTAAAATCPSSQPEALPAGETRTVTIETDKGNIDIRIEADLSPIAAGNFVALAG